MTETPIDPADIDDPDAGPASTPDDPFTEDDKERAEGDPDTAGTPDEGAGA